MKVLTGLIKFGSVVAMAAALAACGGGPSDSEVRNALEKRIQNDLGALSGLASLTGGDAQKMMDSMIPKIENISVQGCDSIGNDVYQCSVEATLKMMGKENIVMEDIRLKKSSEGEWLIVR